jgi:hypothetical protein
MTGPTVIKTARSFFDEMKIIDQCIFPAGWLQNFNEPAAEGDVQMEYSFD